MFNLPTTFVSSDINELYIDVERDILRYEKMRDTASIEGLANIASSVIVGLIDIVLNTANNVGVLLTKLFKDIKRSELQAHMSRNVVQVRKLRRIGYSEIYKKRIPIYPFHISPNTVAAYCTDTFKIFNMRARVSDIIEQYKLLAANVRIGDENKIKIHIGMLDNLNNRTLSDSVLTKLKDIVVVNPPSNHTTFGKVFNSVDECFQAIDTTLRISEEFNEAIAVSKMLDSLYAAYSSLADALAARKDYGLDVSKLKGLSETIRSTGILLERYAVLVKEYSHLDHFLVVTLKNIV